MIVGAQQKIHAINPCSHLSSKHGIVLACDGEAGCLRHGRRRKAFICAFFFCLEPAAAGVPRRHNNGVLDGAASADILSGARLKQPFALAGHHRSLQSMMTRGLTTRLGIARRGDEKDLQHRGAVEKTEHTHHVCNEDTTQQVFCLLAICVYMLWQEIYTAEQIYIDVGASRAQYMCMRGCSQVGHTKQRAAFFLWFVTATQHTKAALVTCSIICIFGAAVQGDNVFCCCCFFSLLTLQI